MSVEPGQAKFAVILNRALPAGVALNTAAHLAAQLGTRVPELGGGPVADRSGVTHSGIPVCGNVILAATAEEVRARYHQARALGAEVVALDYPEQGYTTRTDEEYRDAIAAADEPSLTYYGILLYGARPTVNRLTRGLGLWGQ